MHDQGDEALVERISRRRRDTIVSGQADDKDVRDARSSQLGRELRLAVCQARVAKGRAKARVGLDVGRRALGDDEVEVLLVQSGNERRAGGVLNTVARPESGAHCFVGVGWVGDAYLACEGQRVGVVGRKGDVVGGMPVLGGDFANKGQGEESIDGRDDLASIGDS